MWNVYQYAEIQWLMLIEYAVGNLNTIVGKGYSDQATTVTPTYVDDPQVATASWRGHVGLWGNLWQYIYGLTADISTRNYFLLDVNTGEIRDTEIKTVGTNTIQYAYGFQVSSPVHDNFDCLFLPVSITTNVNNYSVSGYYYGLATSPSFTTYAGFLQGGTCRSSSATINGLFSNHISQNIAVTSAYQGSRISCIENGGEVIDNTNPIIGRWVNNKPIYRYTRSIDNEAIATQHDISTLGIESITAMYGTNEVEDNNYPLNSGGYLVLNNQNLYLTFNVPTGSGITTKKDCNYTIEYTKIGDRTIDDNVDILYSYSEKQIGYWINGKPLYRKVVPGTVPTVINTTYSTDIASLDVETCVKLSGFYRISNLSIGKINQGSVGVTYVNQGTSIQFTQNTASWLNPIDIYFIIEYTKKSDNIGTETPYPYSLEETVVGDLMFNGEQVYQKTIKIVSPTEIETEKLTDISDLNIKSVIDIDGMYHWDITDNHGPINYGTWHQTTMTSVADNKKYLKQIVYNANWRNSNDGHAILRYTKN